MCIPFLADTIISPLPMVYRKHTANVSHIRLQHWDNKPYQSLSTLHQECFHSQQQQTVGMLFKLYGNDTKIFKSGQKQRQSFSETSEC